MYKIKIQQMISPISNREVPNQFIIHTKRGKYFQSYNTIIGFISTKQEIILDEKFWNYSRTTAKYRNEFLGLTTKEIIKAIKENQIKLTSLNS